MTSAPTSGTKEAESQEPALEYTVIVATQKDEDGTHFLMVRHKGRGWELPGGKLEGKEGPVHCALREFREETGHLLADPKWVMKMKRDNGICYVFTGTLGPKVSEIEDDEAIERLAWMLELPGDDLAFPDDPYDEIGQELGITFR